MKRGWRKDVRLIPIESAAAIIGLKHPSSTWHVIEVGDLRPRYLKNWSGKGHWPASDKPDAGFSWDDILRFSHEFNVRRRFRDFRAEYADVLMLDDPGDPHARGLELGPGWEGILREFGGGLRQVHQSGYRYYLRWGKEKFGGLRLFITKNPDSAEDIAASVKDLCRTAYRQSLQTCEECGRPGRLRMGIAVCLTLCDRHQHMAWPLNLEDDGIILDLEEHANGDPK